MADWANLMPELLAQVAQRLAGHDFIVFRAVCKPWQFASLTLKEKPPLPPWLDEDGLKDAPKIRRFFNLSTLKAYEFELPEASGRNCVGASYGCIFTLGHDLQISLVHPFTRKQISLPSMLAFSDHYAYHHEYRPQELFSMFVEKVALSSNPWLDEKTGLHDDHTHQDCCVIAAIYGEVSILAFARLGDEVWTNIRVPSKAYEDIIFHQDKLYAVDCHGSVVACDIDDDKSGGDGPRAKIIAPIPYEPPDYTQKYLVESSGDLLLVARTRGGEETEDGEVLNYYTIGFSVLKLEDRLGCHDHLEENIDDNEYPYKWTEVSGLGDRALFLGRNPSASLPAYKYNGSLKPNCIYFTDDDPDNFWGDRDGGGLDMGIFNLENGTIEPHFPGKSIHPEFPPFWLMM
ncbi:unnamed protein product [Coffea canephora]|uniref:KIB1-4 beta-propeller domain-containing protein n=1 Tax=Coffea canephora TaxID=49390 RepID=A0A068UE30_COFCA|nr:unnamed protein product [Coffea canephora]